MNKFMTKYFMAIFGGIFALVGTIIIIVGIITNVKMSQFKESAVEVNGVIEDIVIEEHTDETDYDVFVAFEYDGEYYEDVHLDFYSSSMYEGQEIELLIDPDNPTDVHTSDGDLFFTLMFVGLGGLFALIGYIILIVSILNKKKKAGLLERGQHIYGEIESMEQDYSITINGRHPFRIYCKYKNPTDGYIYKFKSDTLDFNPWDSYKTGDSIDIYVDPDNFKKYYVDAVDKAADIVRDYT